LIWITRHDGSQLLLNDDQILYVEVQGDTLVALADGTKLRVLESADELTRRIAHWRRRVLGLALVAADEIEE
jgi:uncharacterized protein YlzI (FlbEa/FlbD family)